MMLSNFLVFNSDKTHKLVVMATGWEKVFRLWRALCHADYVVTLDDLSVALCAMRNNELLLLSYVGSTIVIPCCLNSPVGLSRRSS